MLCVPWMHPRLSRLSITFIHDLGKSTEQTVARMRRYHNCTLAAAVTPTRMPPWRHTSKGSTTVRLMIGSLYDEVGQLRWHGLSARFSIRTAVDLRSWLSTPFNFREDEVCNKGGTGKLPSESGEAEEARKECFNRSTSIAETPNLLLLKAVFPTLFRTRLAEDGPE